MIKQCHNDILYNYNRLLGLQDALVKHMGMHSLEMNTWLATSLSVIWVLRFR